MSAPDPTRNRTLLATALGVVVAVVLTGVVFFLISTRAYLSLIRLKWPALLLGGVLAIMGLVFIAKARSSRAWPMSTRLSVFVGPGLGSIALSAGLLCEGFTGGDLAPATLSLLQVFTWIGEVSLFTASGIALVSGARRAKAPHGPVEGVRRDGDVP